MPAEFSSFRKRQLTFEARYDDAYLLWDRTGAVWTTFQQFFKTLKPSEIRPERQTFHGDGRFNVHVSLNRMSITDVTPDASWDKSFEIIGRCFQEAATILDLNVLTRIGTRFQYAIETKTLGDARKRVAEYSWAMSPGTLFQIEPKSVAPYLKYEADDGELGYIAQMYAQERKIEVEATPDLIAAGLDPLNKSVTEFVADFDFMTKKPMSVESFKVMPWLTGWLRAVNRDADKFLNLGHKQ